jgi:hypothetical protein
MANQGKRGEGVKLTRIMYQKNHSKLMVKTDHEFLWASPHEYNNVRVVCGITTPIFDYCYTWNDIGLSSINRECLVPQKRLKEPILQRSTESYMCGAWNCVGCCLDMAITLVYKIIH